MIKMGSSEVFLKHVCKIVDNLTGSPLSITKLSSHAEELIKVFLDFLVNPSRSNNILSTVFNVIINLIKCSCSIALRNQYIEYVLKNFGNIHSLQS